MSNVHDHAGRNVGRVSLSIMTGSRGRHLARPHYLAYRLTRHGIDFFGWSFVGSYPVTPKGLADARRAVLAA